MKVSECDFCNAESKHLWPVNDDLWAICEVCMDLHYRILPAYLAAKERWKNSPREKPEDNRPLGVKIVELITTMLEEEE